MERRSALDNGCWPLLWVWHGCGLMNYSFWDRVYTILNQQAFSQRVGRVIWGWGRLLNQSTEGEGVDFNDVATSELLLSWWIVPQWCLWRQPRRSPGWLTKQKQNQKDNRQWHGGRSGQLVGAGRGRVWPEYLVYMYEIVNNTLIKTEMNLAKDYWLSVGDGWHPPPHTHTGECLLHGCSPEIKPSRTAQEDALSEYTNATQVHK